MDPEQHWFEIEEELPIAEDTQEGSNTLVTSNNNVDPNDTQTSEFF